MTAQSHKSKGRSVKHKIFLAFMIFGGIMLVLLWVFQVQFLDQFYRMIKSHSVKSAAESITAALSDEDYKTQIETIARENDLCVSVLDEAFSELYTSNRRDPRCMIDKLKQSEINSIYEEAAAAGGSVTRITTLVDNRLHDIKEMPPQDQGALMEELPKKEKGIEHMIYMRLLQGDDNDSLVVMVNAQISPVDATVETIRTQLVIITVLLLLLAMLLAYIMSKKIAKPIITVNQNAKQLANGNYEVTFSGSEYLEISELNDTLNYAAKELSKVQNLQRELIANMSHDLRTPLTMISGYGEMMRDIPGENTPENVQIMIDEANRLTYLVNDILDLSKLQAGVQTLQLSDCAITRLIGGVVKRYAKMVEGKDYHIDFQYEKECVIQGDEIKLNQVIYNLINNAVTYCGEDRRVVIKQSVGTDAVRIEITDHGAGIPQEELPYVWERYYKSKQHHVRATAGSGIGLSIVKNILELHHAQYGVESEVGKGTTFWMELPISNHHAAANTRES